MAKAVSLTVVWKSIRLLIVVPWPIPQTSALRILAFLSGPLSAGLIIMGDDPIDRACKRTHDERTPVSRI